MTPAAEIPNHPHEPIPVDGGQSENAGIILLELDRILESRFFKNAGRSRQFLQYVVRNKLDGNFDHLKERVIGTEIFQRSPNYATGDDPVVRVQAGEVRRRLEQYYQEAPDRSPVRIELPLGSYSPQFNWASTEEAEHAGAGVSSHARTAPAKGRRVTLWALSAACLALAVCSGFLVLNKYRGVRQQSTLEKFWAPVFSTQQPVLICLAKGVTYRPNLELYQRYIRTHPGTFQSEVERSNDPLPLDGNEKLLWSDMVFYDGWGVALGDVDAAVKVSAMLGQLHKLSQVRVGQNYSFEDLRNSPAVIVGAFNNKWTMRLTSNLHFAFVENQGQSMIREQISGGRVWITRSKPSQHPAVDYAIVARLLDSNTGQFTITAAGLEDSGTRAAGEFITNPGQMEIGLRGAPADWQKKNMELVLQTTVTDSVPGPPQVLAIYYW